MERPEAANGRQADRHTAAPMPRFTVIVGEPAVGGAACRIEQPARLLRVWSLLRATYEQMDRAALPSVGMPPMQRQLQMIRHDLEKAVSPPLAAELRRILPSQDAVPSAGALRIECAALLSWTSSLVTQMLSALAAQCEHLLSPSAAA